MFVSLVIALNIICNKKNYTSKVNYSLIPKNKIRFFDIILNNVSAKNSGIQVGVNFKETLCDNEIIFKPIIRDVGDLTNFLGHREIDLSTINYNRDLISFKIGAELNESLANSLNL